ncbi:hypothetical protein C8Q74DRAFT_1283844 [Fomes fomentarius]|nr:hypothetical protein C8Q74DRAFT_1283844 [Fomes fomentarius]
MTLLDTLPLLCNQSIPMRRNVLPVELDEFVIDLIDDEKTLRATSLVCKAWLARSRYNLFRVVELQIPNHLDRLLDLLTDTPDVAPLIKEIAISENSLLSLFRPALSIVARFPHSLSAHPRLQPHRLMVHHQLWIPTRYDAGYLCGLSQYSCITSLDLFDVTFDSVADFSIVIRALRNLESLSATYVECERGMHSDILRAIGSELPSLTSLRVNSPSPTLAADWLLQYNTFPSLTTADISYEICHSIFESAQGLGPFWVSTGSTLEHLCLSISKKGSASQIPLDYIQRQLDLSPCTALRTLRLDCRDEREVSPEWNWVLSLLSHLPRTSSALRTITLAFQHSSHALATLLPFAGELDRVLASASSPARLTKLDAVVFEFEFPAPAAAQRDEDEEALLEMFPLVREAGLLRVA